MMKTSQLESIQAIVEKTSLFRVIFFIFLPIALYIDFITYESIGVLYISLMILTGLAFHFIGIQILISGLLVLIRHNFSPDSFINWDLIFFQWVAYFLISFVILIISQKYLEQRANIIQLTKVLAKSLDSRDPYTADHSEKVAQYSKMIAEEMGFSKSQTEDIYNGGLLHDIGKIGVPEAILTKPSRLTEQEYSKIKEHPTIGYNILKVIPSFRSNGILDIVLFHHERMDGKGYPMGLRGEEIPIKARIVAVADAFDAMTSQRTYRGSQDIDYAVNEITRNIGTQFDEDVVNAFLKVISKRRDEFQNLDC